MAARSRAGRSRPRPRALEHVVAPCLDPASMMPGQTVACRPVFERIPGELYVKLSCPLEPSSLDLVLHRGLDGAARLLVSGWQVDPQGHHLGRRYRDLPVWRDVLVVEAVQP